MPLELLAPFVVLAVAVIMLVISRSGLSRKAALRTEAEVRARFALDFPGFEASDVLIDDTNTTALLPDGAGAVGLVRAFGDRTTTRLLQPGAVTAVRDTDRGLQIGMTDFTWPQQAAVLSSADDKKRWKESLAPLQKHGASAGGAT